MKILLNSSFNFKKQWGVYLSYCVDEWHNKEVLIVTTHNETNAKTIAAILEKSEIKGWYNSPSKITIRQDILTDIN